MKLNWNYEKLNPEPLEGAGMSANETKYSTFLYQQYLLWIIKLLPISQIESKT